MSNCGECSMRIKAENNPNKFMARVWKWHTKWCPGWKAYQAELAQKQTLE